MPPIPISSVEQNRKLVELAERTFPIECAQLTARRLSPLTPKEARTLLGKIPISWAGGFYVDGASIRLGASNRLLTSTFDPQPMHLHCFKVLGDQSVALGLERPFWWDVILMWPADLTCTHCGKTEPPIEKVAERVRWDAPLIPRDITPDVHIHRNGAILWIVLIAFFLGLAWYLHHMPLPPDEDMPPTVTLPYGHANQVHCPPGYSDPAYMNDALYQCRLDPTVSK